MHKIDVLEGHNTKEEVQNLILLEHAIMDAFKEGMKIHQEYFKRVSYKLLWL